MKSPFLLLLLMHSFVFAQTFDIQGHRGARGLFPENSIVGFIEALKIGVKTLELDVVISKDQQVVISHEPWMSATICNTEADDKDRFNIYKMTYAEIKKFDCGSKPHPKFPQQQKIATHKPLLAEMIDSIENFVKQNNLPLPYYNIETKSSPDGDDVFHPKPEKFMELVYEVIRDKGILERCIIQSFDPRTLIALKEINCFLPQALLVANANGVKKNLARLPFQPAIYSPNYLLLNKSTVTYCRSKGIKAIPWTVNDAKTMKKIKAMGCDGVITDYPNVAVKELR